MAFSCIRAQLLRGGAEKASDLPDVLMTEMMRPGWSALQNTFKKCSLRAAAESAAHKSWMLRLELPTRVSYSSEMARLLVQSPNGVARLVLPSFGILRIAGGVSVGVLMTLSGCFRVQENDPCTTSAGSNAGVGPSCPATGGTGFPGSGGTASGGTASGGIGTAGETGDCSMGGQGGASQSCLGGMGGADER